MKIFHQKWGKNFLHHVHGYRSSLLCLHDDSAISEYQSNVRRFKVTTSLFWIDYKGKVLNPKIFVIRINDRILNLFKTLYILGGFLFIIYIPCKIFMAIEGFLLFFIVQFARISLKKIFKILNGNHSPAWETKQKNHS